MQNEEGSTRYVGTPVGVVTVNIFCYGEMADDYFSEISAMILNILRQGSACEIIIEARTAEETITASFGLQRELNEAISPVPALDESISFREKVAYQSRNPDGSESWKKVLVALYSIDISGTIEIKQGLISRVVSRIKRALSPAYIP